MEALRRFRHVLPHFSARRGALALGIMALLATNLLQQGLPLLLRHAIDSLRGGAALRMVVLWGVLRAGLVLLQAGLRYAWRLELIGTGRRVEHGLRGHLFGHLLSQPRDFTLRWSLGELLARALGDLAALREFMGRGWVMFFDGLSLTVLTVLSMGRLDARLTLICLLPLLFIPLLVVSLGRRVNRLTREGQDALDGLSRLASESFAGARTIKAYAREEAEAARFAQASAQAREKGLAVATWTAFYSPLLSVFTGCSMVLLFWLGGGRVLEGAMTVGTFVAMFDYLLQLSGPLRNLGMTANLYQRGKASVDRINQVFDDEPAITSAPGAPAPGFYDPGAALEWRAVEFSYTPGQAVLQGLSLRAEPGSWLGLSGEVGSGKSTLLRLALRLHDPDTGALRFGGVDLRDLDLRAWRAGLGWAGQDCAILSLTVAENLRLGEPEAGEPELLSALEAAGLAEEVLALPKGLDTMLGERGVNLSGGQRQRLGLARALLGRPRLLLLDDTLSAVDTVVEARILSSLRRRLSGVTVVLAAHRASTLASCDKVAVLREGRVAVQEPAHA